MQKEKFVLKYPTCSKCNKELSEAERYDCEHINFIPTCALHLEEMQKVAQEMGNLLCQTEFL